MDATTLRQEGLYGGNDLKAGRSIWRQPPKVVLYGDNHLKVGRTIWRQPPKVVLYADNHLKVGRTVWRQPPKVVLYGDNHLKAELHTCLLTSFLWGALRKCSATWAGRMFCRSTLLRDAITSASSRSASNLVRQRKSSRKVYSVCKAHTGQVENDII